MPSIDDLLPSQSPPESIPNTIIVQQYEVIGSTVFSQRELAKVLEPFTNRPISFIELLQAQEAITELYRQQGYITSGGYIPPQTIQNGIVKIEVIEGKVEQIEITGLTRLKSHYIRSRLALATKAPLNQNTLLNALQLLRLNPLIAQLSAELAEGSRVGSSILTVQVQEASAFSLLLAVDNQRVSNVGTNRRIVQLSHNNLLGFGDRLNVRYYNTDGSNAIDDFNYEFPVNPNNGSLSFRYRFTDSKVIESPFNELDINSDYQDYEISFRQPILQTPNQELSLGLSVNRQNVNTSVLDLFEAKTRNTVPRFFQEYTRRTNRDIFAMRSQFNLGVEAYQVSLAGEESNRSFLTWRGQFQYFRVLTSDTSILFRSELQLSSEPLLPLEQFSLGGQYSVRGYPQDAILADNGFFASVELRNTILRIPSWETNLQLVSFFDFGTVWNSNAIPLIKYNLNSVGLGLQLLIEDNFNARLDWGIPLTDFNFEQSSLQDNGIYFLLEYKIF